MKRLDIDNVFSDEEATQFPLERSATDARWDLPEPAFLRWWRALPEEDRAEFVGVFGGDQTLARFVCALDYLTTMQARAQSGSTIVEAYAIAAGLEHDSDAARKGATIAWKHDSVQALMDRLRYRSARQSAARITNRATALIESMLREADNPDVILKDKAQAVKVALTFMKQVTDEDIQERVERTRRGFVKAREALAEPKDEIENITDEQAVLHLQMLKEQFGSEKLKALLG